jgi:hypothetical protein
MNTTATKTLLGPILFGLCLSGCGSALSTRQGNSAKPAMVQEQLLSVNSFQRIHGTRYLKAEITQEEPTRGLGSSGKGGLTTRNLVFVDGETLDSHKLFDQNSYLIVSSNEYPTSERDNEATAKTVEPATQWLVHDVIKSDTNGNGQLDFQDQHTIGFTEAGGAGYTEVLSGLDQVLSVIMLTPGKLVVVYARAGSRSASVVDLGQHKVIMTRALTDLGPDVKYLTK